MIPSLDVRAEETLDLEEALALYRAVQWSAYTDHPDVLAAALAGSNLVVTARVGDRLVGLARALSDGASICYVQDLLVRPESRPRGTARALMAELLERFAHCRQFVLITDRGDATATAFYRSIGLVDGEQSGTAVFQRMP